MLPTTNKQVAQKGCPFNSNKNQSQITGSSSSTTTNNKNAAQTACKRPHLDDNAIKVITRETVRATFDKLLNANIEIDIQRDPPPYHPGLTRPAAQGILINGVGAIQLIRGHANTIKTIKGQFVHPSIYCDVCNKQILGPRYKCIICHDYDLCAKCDSIHKHSDLHPTLLIPRPILNGSFIRVESNISPKVMAPRSSPSAGNIWESGDDASPWFCSRNATNIGPKQQRSGDDLQEVFTGYGIQLVKYIIDQSLILKSSPDANGQRYHVAPRTYAAPCESQYIRTLRGSGFKTFAFTIKNDTCFMWVNMSLQSRHLFQTFVKIVKNVYIVDWHITNEVEPEGFALVQIKYYFVNDEEIKNKGFFQQDWILKFNDANLVDLKCQMHFEETKPKKFCLGTSSAAIEPSTSTSSAFKTRPLHPTVATNPDQDSARTKDLIEGLSKGLSKEFCIGKRHIVDEDDVKRGYDRFRPPGLTPTSTPAGAMSPKSLDLVANSLNLSTTKPTQSSLHESEVPPLLEEPQLVSPCDNRPKISPQIIANNLIEHQEAKIKDGPNENTSTVEAETKIETFFFLQAEDPRPQQVATNDAAIEETASQSVETNEFSSPLASPIVTIKAMENLSLENIDESDMSSSEDLSSDYVVVKLPSCFDLDVPFNEYKTSEASEKIEDDGRDKNIDNITYITLAPTESPKENNYDSDPWPIRSQPSPTNIVYPDLGTSSDFTQQQQAKPVTTKPKKVSSFRSFVWTQGDDDDGADENGDEEVDKDRDLLCEEFNKNPHISISHHSKTGSSTIEVPSAPLAETPDDNSMMNNLSKLSDMGFSDRQLNGSLLLKHNQDLDAVLEELLQKIEGNSPKQCFGQ